MSAPVPMFTRKEAEMLISRVDAMNPEELRELVNVVTELERRQAAAQCQSDLITFARRMMPDYLVGKHHARLARLLSDLAEGRKKRICVNFPPRHGKSTLVSILFVAWYLGKFPDRKVMMVSHTTDLAVDFGRKVRNLIASPEYQQVFPGTSLSVDSKSAGRWNTSAGGEFFACIEPHTPVRTAKGVVCAEEVKVGDHVASQNGFCEVMAVMETTHACTVRVDGVGFSAEHPIWVFGRGFITAQHVHEGDLLWVESIWGRLWGVIRRAAYGTVEHPHVPPLVQHEVSMRESEEREVSSIWWARYIGMRTLAAVRGFFVGYGTPAVCDAYDRPHRCERAVQPRELPLGNPPRAGTEQAQHTTAAGRAQGAGYVCMGRGGWYAAGDDQLPHKAGDDAAGSCKDTEAANEKAQGTDITENCGWVRRAAVRFFTNRRGQPRRHERPTHPQRYMAGIGRAAQNISGLVLGVRRVRRVVLETHAPSRFVNYSVSGTNTFFAAGVLTHNCGIGSSIAGRGAHLLLCDDPHSEQDVLSGNFEVFEKAYDWYTYGARTRLMPKGAVAIVSTRWHQADLTGRLIQDMATNPQADQFDVFEFPAIIETQGENGEIIEKALWPEFFDLDALHATKASMPAFQWNAQYQQNPTGNEGAVVKRDMWRWWTAEDPPKCSYVIMTMDCAAEMHNRADFSALAVWGVFNNETENAMHIILLNLINERVEFPELKERAKKEYKYWQPDAFIVEKKVSGAPLYQELRRSGVIVQEFTPHRGTGDKLARLNAVADIIRSGLVWLPRTRWAEEVVEQMTAFPHGSHDDLVDVTVMALQRFRAGGFISLPNDPRYDEDQVKRPRHKAYY